MHVILVVLCTVPAMLLQLLPVVGWLLMFAVAIWAISRLSLVFPAIAIGRALNIPAAWRVSKDHQAPLLIAVGLFPFILAIPIYILAVLPMTSVVVSVLSTVTTVFSVAALSLAYREIYRVDFGA